MVTDEISRFVRFSDEKQTCVVFQLTDDDYDLYYTDQEFRKEINEKIIAKSVEYFGCDRTDVLADVWQTFMERRLRIYTYPNYFVKK